MSIASEEFAILFAPYRRELLVHCYRMLGSAHDAEDVVQRTYLRAWRSFGDLEGRSNLRLWLCQIAANAALRELEKGRAPRAHARTGGIARIVVFLQSTVCELVDLPMTIDGGASAHDIAR